MIATTDARDPGTFYECPWCEGAGCLACGQPTDYGIVLERRLEAAARVLADIREMADQIATHVGDLTLADADVLARTRDALGEATGVLFGCPVCDAGEEAA